MRLAQGRPQHAAPPHFRRCSVCMRVYVHVFVCACVFVCTCASVHVFGAISRSSPKHGEIGGGGCTVWLLPFLCTCAYTGLGAVHRSPIASGGDAAHPPFTLCMRPTSYVVGVEGSHLASLQESARGGGRPHGERSRGPGARALRVVAAVDGVGRIGQHPRTSAAVSQGAYVSTTSRDCQPQCRVLVNMLRGSIAGFVPGRTTRGAGRLWGARRPLLSSGVWCGLASQGPCSSVFVPHPLWHVGARTVREIETETKCGASRAMWCLGVVALGSPLLIAAARRFTAAKQAYGSMDNPARRTCSIGFKQLGSQGSICSTASR